MFARRWVLGVVALVVLCVGIAGGAAAYDHGRSDRIAAGIRIGNVEVGGLDTMSAVQRVQRLAVAPRRRSLTVHVRGRSYVLSASKLRVSADVEAAVARALADSRRGWLGARVARELTGGRVDERIALVTHYAAGVIGPFAEHVARKTQRKPVDATVVPSANGLTEKPSKAGLAVDSHALRDMLARAAVNPSRPADIAAPTRKVDAKVQTSDLVDKYAAYIIIERGAHKLRFFRRLELTKTYDIAVGKSGLETPAGLYDIQWKETNPKWRVPNSSWAGSLAGKTIPAGPGNPIQARWLAFNGGAGIHGTTDDASIGSNASHGCVRMHIPDVIELYAHTPIGTPVYVL
ncbi:MAG: L,D-transpeptidase/peptidoglycan binding protein [Actinobacteria bacterium]|nr:L,D-transpeptidase/peptidoglycan binding protein [Actinomycetota bacterium]